jgi:hypothetical protein
VPKRKVDFSGVSEDIRSGGRSKHIPEGDYLLKIMEGVWEEGQKADYIRWRFQVAEGKQKGVTLYANTSLSQKALWNLRNLIHAAVGRNVAGKAVNFDPDSLTGKIVGASVEDNEYNDRLYSTPVDFFTKDKFESSETEEEDSEEESDEEETEEEEEDEELEDVDVEDL